MWVCAVEAGCRQRHLSRLAQQDEDEAYQPTAEKRQHKRAIQTAVTAEKRLSLGAAGSRAGEIVAGSCCSSEFFRNANRIYWEENKANKSYWGLEQKAQRAEGGEPTGGQKRGMATGIGSLGFTGQVVRDTRIPGLEMLRGLYFG